MNVTETELRDIRKICLRYYDTEKSGIRSIILYGGAAKNYVGQNHEPGDFDLNIFFSKQSLVSSTYGMPKMVGEYNGLEVEVMRNKVPEEMNIEQYVKEQDSKRWHRIRDEPIIQIYPNIEQVNWKGL